VQKVLDRKTTGKLKNPKELVAVREQIIARKKAVEKVVRVCIGTGCAAKGSRRLYDLFCEAVKESGHDIKVEAKCVGCHGFCERGPIVVIEPGNIFYQRVEEPDVGEIFRETVMGGRVVERLLYEDPESGKRAMTEEDIPFYKVQKRIVLAGNGLIDPTDIEDYISLGGYSALAKALTNMTPDQIIEEVEKSARRQRCDSDCFTGGRHLYDVRAKDLKNLGYVRNGD